MEKAGELAWRVVELYLGGTALPSEEKARLRLCMEIVIGILDPDAVRPEPAVPPDASLPKPEEKPPAPPKQEDGEPHPFAVRLLDWMRANQKNCSRVRRTWAWIQTRCGMFSAAGASRGKVRWRQSGLFYLLVGSNDSGGAGGCR